MQLLARCSTVRCKHTRRKHPPKRRWTSWIKEPQLREKRGREGKPNSDEERNSIMEQVEEAGSILQKKVDGEGQTVLDEQGNPMMNKVDLVKTVLMDIASSKLLTSPGVLVLMLHNSFLKSRCPEMDVA